MTTAVLPIEITCPDWCKVTPGEHVAELWDNEGHCFHYGPETKIRDSTGWYNDPLGDPIMNEPALVSIAAQTTPDGRRTAEPTIFVSAGDLSLKQALALATEIQRQVAMVLLLPKADMAAVR